MAKSALEWGLVISEWKARNGLCQAGGYPETRACGWRVPGRAGVGRKEAEWQRHLADRGRRPAKCPAPPDEPIGASGLPRAERAPPDVVVAFDVHRPAWSHFVALAFAPFEAAHRAVVEMAALELVRHAEDVPGPAAAGPQDVHQRPMPGGRHRVDRFLRS